MAQVHHHFTEEEKNWLASQDPDLTYKAITVAFNERYGTQLSTHSIADLMGKRMKLRRTPKGRFKDGAKPKHPIGAEVIKQGYVWVKVDDQYFEGKAGMPEYYQNWKRKSDIVWENQHGEIPDGYFLIFLDGNPLNCAISNLHLVNRSIHAQMCKNNWYSDDPELTRVALTYCELMRTITELKDRSDERRPNIHQDIPQDA